MFTIRSTSDEGVWYLVNHWNRWKAFWQKKDKCSRATVFKRECDAKRSLTKLLKVMPEYRDDRFEMVSIRWDAERNEYIYETLYEM